jgi:NAD(P)-dependent dehydrogenase (short-subunit alcohol dehydrogenase family)
MKNVFINGGAGALGRSFGRSFHFHENTFDTELADRREEPLREIANRIGITRISFGDALDQESEAYAHGTESRADIIVWNMAINVDEIAEERRLELRQRQTSAFRRRIETLLEQGGNNGERRLFIPVNSIAAIFGKELEFAREWAIKENKQYGIMKAEQSELIEENREALFRRGIDVLKLHPGSFWSGFTNVREAFKHANGFGKKIPNYRGRKNLRQEKILKRWQITRAVAQVAKNWVTSGMIPDDKKEWIMLNASDLVVEDSQD